MEFLDKYEHRDPKVTYTPENINTEEIEDLIEHEFPGCSCENKCDPQICSCSQRSGAFYLFSDRQQLNNYVLNIANAEKPVYECNDNCKCKNVLCGNKLVQFGPRKNLKIINEPTSQTKGFGLVTEHPIEKGNFICEYAGEVITQAEAHKRYEIYSDIKLGHNYIFCINENFGKKNEKTFIDPTFYGNIGRYINHSCNPNCFLVPVRIQTEIPKLCIFAKNNIEKSAEITFDYGETDNNADLSRKPCLCFSPNCRKYLPFDGTI